MWLIALCAIKGFLKNKGCNAKIPTYKIVTHPSDIARSLFLFLCQHCRLDNVLLNVARNGIVT